MDTYSRALIERSAPFEFDLVRSTAVAEHLGVSKEQAARIIESLGGEQMPRATSGGVPAFRLWAVRDVDAWRRRTPTARVQAYLRHHGGAFDPLAA